MVLDVLTGVELDELTSAELLELVSPTVCSPQPTRKLAAKTAIPKNFILSFLLVFVNLLYLLHFVRFVNGENK